MVRTHYLPIAKRTFERWISAGQFPRPDMTIGGKARFWRRESVEKWIENNANETK
ncbi:MAG: helix-turn-helix domain-containing protein [Phycisphaerales bacterium]|jgi:predicted DNA-binding transcriptional regulator AlpA|nr:helix-turn-helix domain-containing protein [Phycisphaerales bacterium]